MVTRIGVPLLATLALLLGCAASAAADPTQHFTGTFDITCGGNTLTLVAKPGSSNVLTVNGEPSNSVSILFGVSVRMDGDDYQKATDNPNVIVCQQEAEPGTEVTLRVINTPPGA